MKKWRNGANGEGRREGAMVRVMHGHYTSCVFFWKTLEFAWLKEHTFGEPQKNKNW